MKVAMGEAVFERCGERARAVAADLEFAVMGPDGVWSSPPETCDLILLAGDGYAPAFLDRMCEIPAPAWAHTEDAGTDGRFYDAMRARGAAVTHSPGANAPEVAEFALGFVLFALKRYGDFRDAQRAHRWEKLPLESLSDKTVLVLGLGAIGARVAELCRAFDMRVLGIRRSAEPVAGLAGQGTLDDLPAMLAEADIVIAALPHADDTVRVLDASAIGCMKPGSVLVNVGRGTVVDVVALRGALESGHLARACLDVFPTEPVAADDPLWDAPNLFMTPHCASRSPLYLPRSIDMWLDNLERYVGQRALRHQVF